MKIFLLGLLCLALLAFAADIDVDDPLLQSFVMVPYNKDESRQVSEDREKYYDEILVMPYSNLHVQVDSPSGSSPGSDLESSNIVNYPDFSRFDGIDELEETEESLENSNIVSLPELTDTYKNDDDKENHSHNPKTDMSFGGDAVVVPKPLPGQSLVKYYQQNEDIFFYLAKRGVTGSNGHNSPISICVRFYQSLQEHI